MEAKDVWSGEFGNEYLKRNRVDWQARIPFWKYIIEASGARSAFEFGCNAGWNLSAIKRAFPDVGVEGYEINPVAMYQAMNAGLDVYSEFDCDPHELVFTAGVLIHIPPKDIKSVMQSIVDASADYVLAVEYESEAEQEIEYRGQQGLLWKRPYGQMYQDMGLELVDTGKAEGFDDCTYWLLRK